MNSTKKIVKDQLHFSSVDNVSVVGMRVKTRNDVADSTSWAQKIFANSVVKTFRPVIA